MIALISGVALVLASAALYSQSPPAQSPQECVEQGRTHAAKRQKESQPLTVEIYRRIGAERVKMARDCAAAFDVEKMPPESLAPLIELYAEAQMPELADRALARGLATDGLAPAARGGLFVQAIRAGLRLRPKPDFPKLEKHSDALDALPDAAIEQKIAGHTALNDYYRGDDVDAGIIKHSTWLIDRAKTLSAALRKKYESSFVSAYVNLAEAVAGHGDNDRALDLLRRAPTELADVPKVEERLRSTVARYELVGKPAAAIDAPVWLNRAEGATPVDVKGKVTLLQFTAHWCGPCKESYPGMTRLLQRFKDRGLQLVFYTRTYGYFESERPLPREQEIERDRAYFARYGFTHPIAIGAPSFETASGRTVYQEDPVEQSYGVGGIPQINVIDAQGNLRLIMIGYDDANEEKLAAFIDGLLKKGQP